MRNICKVLGAVALAALIGFLIAGCDESQNKQIVMRVTGIPSHYNIRSANISLGADSDMPRYASSSFGTINSGTLELSMYLIPGTEPFYLRGSYYVWLSIISEPGNIIWYGRTNSRVSISQGTNTVHFSEFTGDSPNNDNDGSLNGNWEGHLGDIFAAIYISGKDYVITLNGVNFGKGNITYDASSVELESTHAWDSDASEWTPYVETTTGNYSLSSGTLTLSSITGIYSQVNGVWTLSN